ncbi:MAG: hypothetical protein J5I93_03365 [Pirellulaceae bacterium]|nr:hypothetical protein [Pirellulaceae bacterium]
MTAHCRTLGPYNRVAFALFRVTSPHCCKFRLVTIENLNLGELAGADWTVVKVLPGHQVHVNYQSDSSGGFTFAAQQWPYAAAAGDPLQPKVAGQLDEDPIFPEPPPMSACAAPCGVEEDCPPGKVPFCGEEVGVFVTCVDEEPPVD